METIEKKVLSTIKKFRMIKKEESVVAAVSGGADSMVMLYLLKKLSEILGFSIIAAHLNHNLRGKESEEEAKGVEEFCKMLDIALNIKTIPLKTVRKFIKSRGSLEEKLREARFDFLNETASKYNASQIATAHTIDDQAETVLLRLLRGASTKGLAGIPPVRKPFIRPMIEVTRDEIESYAKKNKIVYFTDSSNFDLRFERNKVRHKLLPFLEENFSTTIKKRLAASASVLQKESEALDKLQDAQTSIIKTEKNGTLFLNLQSFLNLSDGEQLNLLKKAVKTVKGDLRKLTSSHYFALLDIAKSSSGTKFLSLPESIKAVKEYDRLFLYKGNRVKKPFCFKVDKKSLPFKTDLGNFKLEIEVKALKSVPVRKSGVIYLDAGRITFPLTVRSYKQGDRFHPLGLNGTKKVKDYFIDKKIPLTERHLYPLIVSEGVIVSVAGLRASDEAKIEIFPSKTLKISFKKS